MVECKVYKTIGGWDAKVIWISSVTNACYAIHQFGTEFETYPVAHNKHDGKSEALFSINAPPRFDKSMPSDLDLSTNK